MTAPLNHAPTTTHTPESCPVCLSGRGIARVPDEFSDVLKVLSDDLRLALECIQTFGGVPIPVAKAILRNIEPAHAAIDMAISGATAKEPR